MSSRTACAGLSVPKTAPSTAAACAPAAATVAMLSALMPPIAMMRRCGHAARASDSSESGARTAAGFVDRREHRAKGDGVGTGSRSPHARDRAGCSRTRLSADAAIGRARPRRHHRHALGARRRRPELMAISMLSLTISRAPAARVSCSHPGMRGRAAARRRSLVAILNGAHSRIQRLLDNMRALHRSRVYRSRASADKRRRGVQVQASSN